MAIEFDGVNGWGKWGQPPFATINGTGASAKVYYATADSLNSSSVMTDSTGAISETMDYYPFGGIRIDTHPSTSSGSSAFSEQRKYIGQEFDADTGLNYLNARYYNSAIGRFTSQDPMFWNFDQAWLQDPQNQNAYAYARNNPIIASDPSGLTMWIESKPVFDVRGHYAGVHTYYKFEPNNPDEININGLAHGTKQFTMEAYTSDNKWLGLNNKLIKQIGTSETSIDKDYAFGNKKPINSMEITPIEGQTDSQLINSFGKAYNEVDVSGTNYSWWGQTQIPFGLKIKEGNCNVFSYTVGVKAGVKDQMDAFTPDPNKLATGGAPGYRYQLSSQTLSQQIQDRVNVLRERVNNYISSLTNK